ncbi:hypothetical protein BBV17_08975 [Cytobacillus oceanisediminis]|uniref:Uncharacterized protein n=1 Tax=Cytobacillus oceanisediminis TaxID=665099 RepID=A0ABX3CYK2_9BACI|nr:hypothetical protein BBV17_08975 [Cytobacillus oceanisediminis]
MYFDNCLAEAAYPPRGDAPGQGRLRQLNHSTTQSGNFWEDGGQADVATGRGVLRLRSFVGKALPLFFWQVCPIRSICM